MMRSLSSKMTLLVLLTCLAAAVAPWTHAAEPVASSAGAGATTIVVVRHAEKAADHPTDPSLKPAGQERARELAAVLEDAEVAAVYATELKRTQLTAAPVAQRFNLSVAQGPPDAQGLVQEVLSKHAGKTVVVVGHSNTVPEIVKALSGRSIAPIEDEEYDRLFIVVVPQSGPARLIQARYGQP
jgi:broad specificity phosphatase PhoE